MVHRSSPCHKLQPRRAASDVDKAGRGFGSPSTIARRCREQNGVFVILSNNVSPKHGNVILSAAKNLSVCMAHGIAASENAVTGSANVLISASGKQLCLHKRILGYAQKNRSIKACLI